MLPADHDLRFRRALLSLEGLSVGDAFGQRFFSHLAPLMIVQRADPAAPWCYTDDTEMALGIVDVLESHGHIDVDVLAQVFARRYIRDPGRGYGGAAHEILSSIAQGVHWKQASTQVFDGMGSMGNGGAMRVAPIGAYFADDLDTVVEQARLSAIVTHAHPEGQAGAIAVAVAAAVACQMNDGSLPPAPNTLLEQALIRTPKGDTRQALTKALALPITASTEQAVRILGNGSRVISSDTVPFSLWCAARHLNNYPEALWTTVAGLGDRDTTCAIVGGIVALSAPENSIPEAWQTAREPLQRGMKKKE